MDVRKTIRLTTAVTAIACAGYVAWTLSSRRAESRRVQEASERRMVEANKQITEKLGGGELKILMLYGNPAEVERGSAGLLCYGVAGAKSVRLEPAVDQIAPSLSRCIEIKPANDTEYTLIAEDGRGATARETTRVRVR